MAERLTEAEWRRRHTAAARAKLAERRAEERKRLARQVRLLPDEATTSVRRAVAFLRREYGWRPASRPAVAAILRQWRGQTDKAT